MSDPESQSTPAAPFVPPPQAEPARQEPARAEGQPQNQQAPNQTGWVDRIREALGLRKDTSLRRDLEQALASDATIDPLFSAEERAMLRNILRLRETTADDLMVPRPDIMALDASSNLRETILAFEESGHSRMPVYRDTLDEPIGMVHIKDLMTHLARLALRRETATALDLAKVDLDTPLVDTDLMREILFVPSSMPATDLLARMQATRIQLALVIDEFGGTDGLVSLEDVVETIVGEIDDEHDDVERPLITTAAEDVFIADARAPLEDVVAAIGPAFRIDNDEDDVDTIGGLVLSQIGRIPVRGEVIPSPVPGYDFEVLDADTRHIKRLRIIGPRAVRPASSRRRRLPGELQDAGPPQRAAGGEG
jgi:CBS domain containing-hemolysin-like protein